MTEPTLPKPTRSRRKKRPFIDFSLPEYGKPFRYPDKDCPTGETIQLEPDVPRTYAPFHNDVMAGVDGLANAPVHPRHRADGWTPERMAEFIDVLGSSASVGAACAVVGMSRTSAYKLRNRAGLAHFRDAWDDALRMSVAVLADTAFERAVEGTKVPIFHKGEQVGEYRRHNDRLLMFLLRVRDPHRYAPVAELTAWNRHRALEADAGAQTLGDRVAQIEQSRDAAPPPPSPPHVPEAAATAIAASVEPRVEIAPNAPDTAVQAFRETPPHV